MSPAGDIAHVHHAIDYIEIAVTDIAAAKAFYAAAFGGGSSTTAPTTPASKATAEMGGLRRDPRFGPAGRW